MALALDGSASATNLNTTSGTVTLSTTQANDIIYVCVNVNNGTNVVSTVTDSAGLTYTRRTRIDTDFDQDTWYAVAPNALSSDTITVTNTAASPRWAICAFGISGASTSSPFDPNSSIPQEQQTTAPTQPSITYSTTDANDFIIGFVASGNGVTYTVNSGFTAIANINLMLVEYQVVSGTVTNATLTASDSASTQSVGLTVDAVVPSSAAPPTIKMILHG